MRMTASWFGSLDPPNTRLWRDRSALERGLPLIVILLTQPDCIRWCSRARNCQGQALRVVAEEATSLDSSCARQLAAGGSGRRNGLSDRTKKPTKEKRCAALLKLLDKKSPIQGVQSLL